MSVLFFSQLTFSQTPPIYVTLWFDTEDYILPQSDDAAKRVAEILTRNGIRATFKIVGEKARVLEQRGRRDVIAALRKHEIGYHSNTHSQQPTPAVYLQHSEWGEGVAEFYARELQGVRDIQRIFGQSPSCYGQPGSSWGPQSYPALKKMGINVYLDEADHVGIDEQPFYYGGMLNIFKMDSNVCRMELFGENNLENGKTKFLAAYEKLKAKGGGTISIYYHPCEWVHTEFWDGVNFRRGANPPRSQWKLPGLRPKAETEKAYRDFEEYVRFIKRVSGVRYATANDLRAVYANPVQPRRIFSDKLLMLARAMQQEITFQQIDKHTFSSAEIFWLLNQAVHESLGGASIPHFLNFPLLQGPTRAYKPAIGNTAPIALNWDELVGLTARVAKNILESGQLPNEIWIGTNSLSPQDYLATIAGAYEDLSNGRRPEAVTLRTSRFTADRYVASDSSRLWGWVIFPEGFHAPKIMELAKLQAWTLKPAVMRK